MLASPSWVWRGSSSAMASSTGRSVVPVTVFSVERTASSSGRLGGGAAPSEVVSESIPLDSLRLAVATMSLVLLPGSAIWGAQTLLDKIAMCRALPLPVMEKTPANGFHRPVLTVCEPLPLLAARLPPVTTSRLLSPPTATCGAMMLPLRISILA